jgi:hypothetical protein
VNLWSSIQGVHATHEVLGIGTVELQVRQDPNRSGAASSGVLFLKDVLHVPKALYNGLGDPILDQCPRMDWPAGTRGTLRGEDGKIQAYFDPKKTKGRVVKLRGPPAGPQVGPSWIDAQAAQDVVLIFSHFDWPEAEAERWKQVQAGGDVPRADRKDGRESSSSKRKRPADEAKMVLPYTTEEKAYLKAKWGDEFHFLRDHGLKISKEDDREEGRLILRALKQQDDLDKEEEDEAEDEEEDEEDDEDEFDQFQGHQSDYNFTHEQLDWIEKHYDNSEAFMITYGLKFYDDDDLKEARLIAEDMMRNDV